MIICDTYGGLGFRGGRTFKDLVTTKADIYVVYYARYATKNIIASGIAKKCKV